MRYTVGEIRFEHLELVCQALVIQDVPANQDDVELPLEINEKIDLNSISDDGRKLILLGLAQEDEVRRFIKFMSTMKADFGNKLTARFKQFYFQGVSDGLTGDELYIFVYSVALDHAGPVESPEMHAAVLSVVASVFTYARFSNMSLLLPDKHITAKDSLVGQSAQLAAAMPEAVSVPRAWAIARDLFPQQPFSRFVLMLDVLVALHIVELRGALLMKLRAAMLRRLSANKDSFEPITFEPGFNVILAERSPDATDQHSRNARGKTTILQIINYCLGGNLPTALRPLSEDEWEFTLEFDLFGGRVSATRPLRGGTRITLEYSGEAQAVLENSLDQDNRITLDDWKFVLGLGLFSLDAEGEEREFRLSGRTLMMYVIRLEALRGPLKIIPQQPIWSSRAHISYLLGLEWRHVRDLTKIQKEAEAFKALEYATSENLLPTVLGNEPDLLLARIQKARQVDQLRTQIDRFQVIDDPESLLQLADSRTEELRELRNESLMDRRLLELYRSSIQEDDPDNDDTDVEGLYRELGVAFSDSALRRLEDVQEFHVKLLSNRRRFLRSEIEKLQISERERQAQIATLTEQRARAMAVLQAGGTLEELNALYGQLNEETRLLTEIEFGSQQPA